MIKISLPFDGHSQGLAWAITFSMGFYWRKQIAEMLFIAHSAMIIEIF